MASPMFYAAVGLALSAALAAQAPAPASSPPSARQDPVPTFRVEVNYVEVTARVVGADANFVRGLTQADFQVFEDGKPQALTTFGLVDLPFVPRETPAFLASSPLPLEPDVAFNSHALDGRLYVIVLDDFHISPHRTSRARDLARRFILERLDANDRASIVVTSGDLDASQELTANRRLLLRAVESVVGRKLPSAMEAKAEQFAREQAAAQSPGSDDPNRDPLYRIPTPADMDEAKRNYQARSALSVVRGIAEWMAAIQGRRKSIVYISEGFDYDLADVFVEATLRDPSSFFSGSGGGSQAGVLLSETKAAIDAATRNNVTIYALDPRGLSNTSIDADLGGVTGGTAPTTALEQRSLGFGRELLGSHMTLQQIAAETGGFAAVNTNDFGGAAARIVEENSSYYVLGYLSNNDAADGRVRTIEVRIPGRDLRVIHRSRYAALRKSDTAGSNRTTGGTDPATTARRLFDAVANPLPAAGLPLRLTAVPHRGMANRANLEVFVEVAGSSLEFEHAGGTFNGVLSLSIGAYDKSGKPAAKPDITNVALKLKPDTHARVSRTGVRVWKRLDVQAGGQYQVRVAARQVDGSRDGSVNFDIEVPDFSKETLSMSGIALASSADASVPTFSNPFEGSLPAAPTLLREFPAGSELAARLEIYHTRPRPPHGMEISTTVKGDDGSTVFTSREQRASQELDAARGGFRYTVRVPMQGWPAGLYVLTIEAVPALGGTDAVSRVVQFKIR